MKKLLLPFCLTTLVFSNEVVEVDVSNIQKSKAPLDMNYLKTLKKDNTRDFYINEYLKGDITSNQAFEILSLIDKMSDKLFFNFAKQYEHDETLAVAQCMNMDTKELVESYADCIVSGLSIKEMSTLSAIDLDLIKQKTSQKYPTFVKKLKVVSSSIPFTKLIVQRKDEFYHIYLNVNEEFRTKYFNYKLPKRTFNKIFVDKKKFNEFLQVTLTNPKLDMLHKSLHGLDDSELNFNSSFLLALNAIRLNDINEANKYLNNAVLKTQDIKLLDKIKFWQYQILKESSILEELANSSDINFYSYFANETLEKDIDYSSFLQQIELFDLQLKEYDINRVALLYAIAKTKSNFESKKISNDFEVGILQLKPSIIKTLSSALELEYNLEDQFLDEHSIKFANIHLNSLEKSFKDPLSLSLAFDSETEFINKKLSNDSFTKNSYEPFFSLELILNEKKEIKKEFMLYYVLYYNSLVKKKKEKISLISISQSLNLSDQKQGE